MMETDMATISNDEQRVWRYLLANRLAEAGDVALNCDVSLGFAQACIDRIGTPRRVFIEEATRADLREDEMNQRREVKPARVRTLETAISLTAGDREESYGPPFDNLSNCAAMLNAYINSKQKCIVRTSDSYEVVLTAEDIAWIMVLLKMVRSFKSGYHPDNYTDAAAYSAIAGECRDFQILEDGGNQ